MEMKRFEITTSSTENVLKQLEKTNDLEDLLNKKVNIPLLNEL